ncbi:MAG: hypothetical protein HYS26_03005 [Candidatus Kaiserbacteria bacterium]|nr:MAG: hypothetical protein HYS26_03005 [Candidatus Kaiserbacteria bacterium]
MRPNKKLASLLTGLAILAPAIEPTVHELIVTKRHEYDEPVKPMAALQSEAILVTVSGTPGSVFGVI